MTSVANNTNHILTTNYSAKQDQAFQRHILCEEHKFPSSDSAILTTISAEPNIEGFPSNFPGPALWLFRLKLAVLEVQYRKHVRFHLESYILKRLKHTKVERLTTLEMVHSKICL